MMPHVTPRTSLWLLLLLVIATATKSNATADLTSDCDRQWDGTPCKAPSGAFSRCLCQECSEPPKLCPPGAVMLQSCGDDSYCAPFNPASKELRCIAKDNIETFPSFDRCEDKDTGDECMAPIFVTKGDGLAALYELPGLCRFPHCLGPAITACNVPDEKPNGASCSYKGIDEAFVAEYRGGHCVEDSEKLTTCEGATATRTGPAKPIASFDNRRKDVPTASAPAEHSTQAKDNSTSASSPGNSASSGPTPTKKATENPANAADTAKAESPGHQASIAGVSVLVAIVTMALNMHWT